MADQKPPGQKPADQKPRDRPRQDEPPGAAEEEQSPKGTPNHERHDTETAGGQFRHEDKHTSAEPAGGKRPNP